MQGVVRPSGVLQPSDSQLTSVRMQGRGSTEVEEQHSLTFRELLAFDQVPTSVAPYTSSAARGKRRPSLAVPDRWR